MTAVAPRVDAPALNAASLGITARWERFERFAVEMLGITRHALRRRMTKYRIRWTRSMEAAGGAVSLAQLWFGCSSELSVAAYRDIQALMGREAPIVWARGADGEPVRVRAHTGTPLADLLVSARLRDSPKAAAEREPSQF